jgi:vitellogenic carboxypeptidase-like protein
MGAPVARLNSAACSFASVSFGIMALVVITVSQIGHAAPAVQMGAVSAPSVDRVASLPGLLEPLIDRHHAGFVTVAETQHLFYWYIESSRDDRPPAELPLVVWLNGGPGASSLTGLLIEGTGPLILQPNRTMARNPHSWHRLGHVLSWDQPVGAGFSYSDRAAGGLVTSMESAAEQLGQAMLGFYERHPEVSKSPLYVVGESFAGKWIPHFAKWVLDHNAAGGDQQIPLAGLGIGNGVMKPLMQMESLPAFASAMGYADETSVAWAWERLKECRDELRKPSPDWKRAYFKCQAVEDNIYSGAVPFIYDIREKNDDAIQNLMGEAGYLSTYLNHPDVRRALNVGDRRWAQADGGAPGNLVSDNLWEGQIADLPDGMLTQLLDEVPRVLFYAGNMDGSMCNSLGYTRVVNSLKWSGSHAFFNATRCTWRSPGGDPAGVVQTDPHGKFTWLTVLNSGHLVPWNAPVAGQEMIRRLVVDGWEGVCS